MHVQITRNDTDLTVSVAGGPEVELLTWTSDCDEETGQPLLTLMLAPDTFNVGDKVKGPEPKPTSDRTQAPVRVWGDPQQQDPRAHIPGWVESLGAQVAANAGSVEAVVAHALREQS